MLYTIPQVNIKYLMVTAIESMRLEASSKLIPERKAAFGQFMTPYRISEYMASLFGALNKKVDLLDAGAGIGTLTVAFLNNAVHKANNISIDAWEVEPILLPYLEKNLNCFNWQSKNNSFQVDIHSSDFILDAVQMLLEKKSNIYTHCIINPPYKKMHSNSKHRRALSKVGIETVNLYSAFLSLCIMLMKDEGEIVAIVPRSFCNGAYYKPFRRLIVDNCCISNIHVFESRSKAFRDDEVLQENIIIKLIKAKKQGDVVISASHDSSFKDYKEEIIDYQQIVKPADNNYFIHIPTDTTVRTESSLFEKHLPDINLEVSTGPVVDFRVKEHCSQRPFDRSVPLIYPHHFSPSGLVHPIEHKKPNWINIHANTVKWLMPKGYYTIVRRFTAKEEKRRIVAYVVNPAELQGDYYGFENHFNVFHFQKHSLNEDAAYGLALFLNSTLVDKYFRIFSGHTQVNATDLRALRYPSVSVLKRLGKASKKHRLNQKEIDMIIAKHE